MAFLKLVAKRLAAQRLLALALLVTMAFSIGVLVAGPIYADASQQAILSGQLVQSPVQTKNLRFLVFSSPGFDESASDQAIRNSVTGLPVKRIIPMAETLSVNVGGPLAVMQAPFLYREGAFDHIKLEGRAPRAPNEVAIPAGVSLTTGVNRDHVILVQAGDSGPIIGFHVTAVFNPPSIRDPFWFGSGTPFPVGESTEPPPLVVTKAGYDQLAARLNLVSQFTWDTYLNLDARDFNEIKALPGRIEQIVRQLRRRPSLEHLTGTTGLAEVVQVAEQRTANVRVPIYLVVFQIGAVALAVLAGVASLALSRQSFELAVLKSRGFTRRQLLLAQAIESTLAAAAAFPLGLLLGMALARLARSSNGPSVQGSTFPIELHSTAVIAGAIGAAVGIGLLMIASIPYISRTVVQERQEASRESRPLLSRFPVEIVVGILGLAAFYEVKTRGLGPNLESGTIDPLVLLAPTLLLFAASFAALRLLLFVLRKLDGVIGRARGLSTYLAGRRLGRSASTSFATALLLILAAGLLVVSTSYRATILRSHRDTAHQDLGADWKVETDPAPQSLAVMGRLPVGLTGIFRGEADPLHADQAVPIQVLGVDPASYLEAGWWRSDYSSRSIESLLQSLQVQPTGVALPTGTTELRVRVEVPRARGQLSLVAMVANDHGTVRRVNLGPLRQGTADMVGRVAGSPKLLSLVVVRASGTESPSRIPIRFALVEAASPTGSTEVLLTGWTALQWRQSSGTAVAGDGFTGLIAGTGDVVAGVVPPDETLPVIASSDVVGFAGRRFDANIGGEQFSVHIVDTVPGFPGIPTGQPFIVVSERALYERTLRVPEPSIGLVEVWASGHANPAQAVRRAGLFVDTVQSSRSIEASLAQLPQSLAIGMHFTAAAGGMALVVIGVAVGLYFGQRRRRFEFAALRAMGTERAQTLGALVGEQAVLVGFGLLAAFALGYALLRLMIPYVAQSIAAPFPRALLVLDWLALGLFAAAVVGATTFGLILALRALQRASITSVLRGEAE
jgi:FtsX-like permease family protein